MGIKMESLEKILNDGVETKNILQKYSEFSSVKKGYKIPNIVHMTFCSRRLPITILNVINKNKQVCKNCIFKFYDDEECETMIKTHFSARIFNAYSSINPNLGAMKADFFRYCILYLMGGIYIDIKSSINVPVFKLIQKNDTCILDIPHRDKEYWRKKAPTYEQWLLIFAPQHLYLHTMICQMVGYIEFKYIPQIFGKQNITMKQQILHVTGPDAFTKAVHSSIHQANKSHRNINYELYFKLNWELNYRQMYKINNKTHYSEVKGSLYK